MKISDLFSMSLKNLWRRKLRTILTLLGVLIGTSSIVLMMSLGLAMNKSISDSIDSMGSMNVITVNRSYGFGPGGPSSSKDEKKLNAEAIKEFEQIPDVSVVSPVETVSVKMKHKKYYSYVDIKGMTKEMFEAQKIELAQGEVYENTKKYDILFGAEIKYQFRDPRKRNDFDDGWYVNGMKYNEETGKFEEAERHSNVDPLNDKFVLNVDRSFGEPTYDAYGSTGENNSDLIRPKNEKVNVIGELKGGSWEFDYFAFASLEAVQELKSIQEDFERQKWPDDNSQQTQKISAKRKEYNQILVFVPDGQKLRGVQDEIKQMGYNANSMLSMMDELNKFTAITQAVLGGIGAVSLLVAAIGITNTMVMSIYERTKEIGVMKVIGASLRDINNMFLTEAAFIGLIGGLLGLGFSFGVSYILNMLTKNANIFGTPGMETKLSIITPGLALGSMMIATGIGIIAGILPARRAMKLSVLSALRNE